MLTLKQEFNLKNFKFNYKPSRHFFESPWFPTPVVIVYRSVFFLYSFSWIIYRLIAHESFRQVVVLFQLTNWAYFVLIIYFFVSSVATIFLYVKQRKTRVGPAYTSAERQVQDVDTKRGHVHAHDSQVRWFQKVQWFFYSVAATMALGATFLHWTHVYKDGTAVSLSDVNVHILNCVFMMIDNSLSSMPVRLLHMMYPMFIAFLYMIASILYWAFISREPIYSEIDYNTNPYKAIGLFLLSILILGPTMHVLYYVTYLLRETVAARRRLAAREKARQKRGENLERVTPIDSVKYSREIFGLEQARNVDEE